MTNAAIERLATTIKRPLQDVLLHPPNISLAERLGAPLVLTRDALADVWCVNGQTLFAYVEAAEVSALVYVIEQST